VLEGIEGFAVGALVGGIAVALGTEQLFDWLWK